jgi:hypothetical protein
VLSRYEVRNRRWGSEMVEQTLTAHAKAGGRRFCGAENFFRKLIYFDLEKHCRGGLSRGTEATLALATRSRADANARCVWSSVQAIACGSEDDMAGRHCPDLWPPAPFAVAGW